MTTRIVVIVLVRNEEHFVTWAIGNALGFCDEWLVIDNTSTDGTPARLDAFARAHPGRFTVVREPRAQHTNSFIQPHVGKDVWMFGLDGDEVHDRQGLARLRTRILSGEFSRYWALFGHSIHARRVDLENGTAVGYVTPQAWPATKLYNMAALDSWHSNTQRLHGLPVFKAGWTENDKYRFYESPWEPCDFRNLHLCFFPRSGIDSTVEMRRNITDSGLRNMVRRPVFRALSAVGLGRGRLGEYLRPRSVLKKPLNYMRGPLEVRSIAGVGRPSDYASLDPHAGDIERLIEEISQRRANEAPPTA